MSARRPGRPRNEDSDAAIVAATLEVVAEVGINNFTVDAVALRAGVGRATIYRRWPSKEALALHAWASCVYDPGIPDTGSVRSDLVALLTADNPKLPLALGRRVLPQLVAAAKVDAELDETFRQIINERRKPTLAVLRRAVERGELPADCDVELVQDALIGPLYYRIIITDEPVEPGLIEQIVDIVLSGAGVAPARAMASSPA